MQFAADLKSTSVYPRSNFRGAVQQHSDMQFAVDNTNVGAFRSVHRAVGFVSHQPTAYCLTL